MPGLWGGQGAGASNLWMNEAVSQVHMRCTKLAGACGLRSGSIIRHTQGRRPIRIPETGKVDDRLVTHGSPCAQVRRRI
jgi:hypothetical protein